MKLSNLTSSGGNNQLLDENPIREVTDEIALEKKEANSREVESTRKANEVGQVTAKRETGGRRSKARPSEKIVRLLSHAGIFLIGSVLLIESSLIISFSEKGLYMILWFWDRLVVLLSSDESHSWHSWNLLKVACRSNLVDYLLLP